MSTPVPGCAAAIAGATSPSRTRRTRAPASRSSAIRSSWRSRSSTTTSTSRGVLPSASATAPTFSVGLRSMSIASIASGPTAIFSMYSAAPGKSIVPRSATAMTAIAFGWPSAVSRVPSSGSTATSTSGPSPFPTSSPLESIGASSFSPSPIPTTPRIETLSRTKRIASTAAWSALPFSPRPIHRAAAMAPASVTRTSSSAMLRSGACRALTASHPFRCLDPDEVETARDHGLGRTAKAEPERFLLALEHAVLVVEAVKVVGDSDRVGRNALRSALHERLGYDRRQLDEPLHELAFLGRERACGLGGDGSVAGVAEDPGDPGVRVLDVVDRVLLRPLGREVDVDLDRLVGAAVGEVPTRGVHADLVHEVVEQDDVAAPLRHLRLRAASRQVDELVEDDLEALGVVAEHSRDCRIPVARAVMVGPEDVDRAVEATLQFVHEVNDVGGAVGGRAVFRAKEHPVLVVAVRRRPRPQRAVLLVGVELRQQLGQPLLELALEPEAVEVDPEPLERRLDPLQHQRHRVALQGGEIVDVRTLVAVLRRLLAAPNGLDRGPKSLDLRARVVVVVLALHLVARELEQTGERIAVRAVASGRDRDRPRRVGRDHLDLHPLAPLRDAASVPVPILENRSEGGREPLVAEEEVDEARPGDLGPLDGLEPGGRCCDLRRDLPRRSPPCPGELQRDVRRVVAVLRLARPLEGELGPRRVDERGRERSDGISRQRSRRRRTDLRAPGSRPASRRRSGRRPPRSAGPAPASCRRCRPASAGR